MRLLLISTVLCLCCLGCGVTTVAGFTPEDSEGEVIKNDYFSDPNQDYVYKADIAVYGKSISGILIIKKIKADTHRLVCTTQFGNKLFDLELTKGHYKVRQVIKELDRKIILRTLIRDFQVLVREQLEVSNRYQNSTYEVRQHQEEKRYHYYFYQKPAGTLSKIVHTSKRKEKFTIQFEAVADQIAEQIEIQHHTIQLKIDLSRLKK